MHLDLSSIGIYQHESVVILGLKIENSVIIFTKVESLLDSFLLTFSRSRKSRKQNGRRTFMKLTEMIISAILKRGVMADLENVNTTIELPDLNAIAHVEIDHMTVTFLQTEKHLNKKEKHHES